MTTRTRDLVDKKEIDELLNFLRNAGNLTDTMALQSIGYKNPASVLSQMKQVGLAGRVLKYALIGLIDEKNLRSKPQTGEFALTFDDSELLFDACRKAREVFPARGSKFMTLQARIAEHMMKVAKKGMGS